MLTGMFYYDYYKPYIIKQVYEGRVASKPKIAFERVLTDVAQARPDRADKTVRLNKALHREVADYAFTLAHGVIGFKDAARQIAQVSERFVVASRREYDLEYLSNDLLFFANNYNYGLRFALGQGHSPVLRACAIEQESVLRNNAALLADFGLSFVEDGNEIMYDAEIYRTQADGGFLSSSMMAELRNMFEVVYSLSRELMTLPLAEHMEFRELRFYYNYQPYLSASDTFGIIESGMIVDVAL